MNEWHYSYLARKGKCQCEFCKPMKSQGVEMTTTATTTKLQHDSDCSLHNEGVSEMLGPCDCSLAPDGGTMKSAAVPEHWTANGEPKPGNPLLGECAALTQPPKEPT